jgi:hypothetical protein
MDNGEWTMDNGQKARLGSRANREAAGAGVTEVGVFFTARQPSDRGTRLYRGGVLINYFNPSQFQ